MSSRQSVATRDLKNDIRDISHAFDMTSTRCFLKMGQLLYCSQYSSELDISRSFIRVFVILTIGRNYSILFLSDTNN